MVDQKGIPLSVIVTSANTHDMKSTTNTLDNVVVKRPSDKQNLCLDKGYDFLEVQRSSIKRRYMPHIRYRGEEKVLIKTRSNKAMGWKEQILGITDSESY